LASQVAQSKSPIIVDGRCGGRTRPDYKTNNMQTAVDFLYEFVQMRLNNEQQIQYDGLFQQAKQMEKEQIIDAWHSSRVSMMTGEQYYNE